MGNCPWGDFIGGNCPGLVVRGELFWGNFRGVKIPGVTVLGGDFSWGAIVRGEENCRGECPDTINHNAVFFNNYICLRSQFKSVSKLILYSA